VEFRIARAAKVTGATLERLVREGLVSKGIPEPDAVVCYGAGYAGDKPVLNALCSSNNKLEQGRILEIGLEEESLPIFLPDWVNGFWGDAVKEARLPCVARKIRHSKGRDMRLCKTLAGIQSVLRNGKHDFFTPVVESDTEYRVWVYRKRVLSVYEKRLTEPEKNTKFGRNRANGWTFHALNSENIPDSIRRVAIAAVAALRLDFGAVDILGSWEDESHIEVKATVLEVNSAPGVSDEHRTGIVKLANRIVKWVGAGCPHRYGGV
jgi:hypothetical protein